jgi:hypothetical protein
MFIGKSLRSGGSILVVTILALLWSGGALADGPNWTYLEAGYQKLDVDVPVFSYKPDGYGIDGSFAIHDNYFIFAGYGAVEDTVGAFPIDVKFTAWNAGFGFNEGLNENTDIFATVSYQNAELDDGVFLVDDDGYGISLGVRTVNNSFDFGAAVDYVDFGGTDGDDFSLSVGAAYKFNETIAAGVDASFGDDVTSWGVGMRFYF